MIGFNVGYSKVNLGQELMPVLSLEDQSSVNPPVVSLSVASSELSNLADKVSGATSLTLSHVSRFVPPASNLSIDSGIEATIVPISIKRESISKHKFIKLAKILIGLGLDRRTSHIAACQVLICSRIVAHKFNLGCSSFPEMVEKFFKIIAQEYQWNIEKLSPILKKKIEDFLSIELEESPEIRNECEESEGESEDSEAEFFPLRFKQKVCHFSVSEERVGKRKRNKDLYDSLFQDLRKITEDDENVEEAFRLCKMAIQCGREASPAAVRALKLNAEESFKVKEIIVKYSAEYSGNDKTHKRVKVDAES